VLAPDPLLGPKVHCRNRVPRAARRMSSRPTWDKRRGKPRSARLAKSRGWHAALGILQLHLALEYFA